MIVCPKKAAQRFFPARLFVPFRPEIYRDGKFLPICDMLRAPDPRRQTLPTPIRQMDSASPTPPVCSAAVLLS